VEEEEEADVLGFGGDETRKFDAGVTKKALSLVFFLMSPSTAKTEKLISPFPHSLSWLCTKLTKEKR
jgi:hypothetical protein